MPDPIVRVSLVTANGRPVGGKVDLDFVPRGAPAEVGAAPVKVRGADASQEV
jgi:hypothetical protein